MVKMQVLAEYYGVCPECGIEHGPLESLSSFECDCEEIIEPYE